MSSIQVTGQQTPTQTIGIIDTTGALVGTAANPMNAQQPKAGTGTTTRVATSTTLATLKAANTNRKGLTVYNESAAILYVLCGSGASATNYTYACPANGYYELPYSYTGGITAILASGTGNAQVTEFT